MRVRVKARDRVSGVKRVQITRNRKRPGRWRRYLAKRSYAVSRRTAYVRVRDRAGNRSRWRVVRTLRRTR